MPIKQNKEAAFDCFAGTEIAPPLVLVILSGGITPPPPTLHYPDNVPSGLSRQTFTTEDPIPGDGACRKAGTRQARFETRQGMGPQSSSAVGQYPR